MAYCEAIVSGRGWRRLPENLVELSKRVANRQKCFETREGPPDPVALAKGFQVLPKRWIVERLRLARLDRKLSKDYELCHKSTETMIHMDFVNQLLRRFI